MPEDLDWKALREEAQQRLPLSQLLSHYGKPPASTTRWCACPECGKQPGKFKITSERSFRCVMLDCKLNPHNLPADIKPDGPGLVAVMEGLPSKLAFFRWLHIAGVIDDETHERLSNPSPSSARRSKKKAGKQSPTPAAETETEAPVEVATAEPVAAPAPAYRDLARSDGSPWHDLWQAMRLGDGDRTTLANQRGLNKKTIDFCGFRTSRPSNAKLIEDLRTRYEDDDLIELGILRNDDSRGIRPEPQLCGWGITSEKDPDTGKHKFAQTNPILIPYFGPEGQVCTMRAHKGGLPKRLLPGEISYRNYSHPYGEHFLRDLNKQKRIILTEGEIKAAAAYQCGIPVLAVPGISFVSNDEFRRTLLKILRRRFIEEVVVIYDNEVKDDPALPGYKEDETKRYDVYVWAEVMAWHLRKAGIRRVTVGKLPDEFRERGKADFDGVLRQLVERHGPADGTREAGKVFREAMDASTRPHEFIDQLFPDRASRIIHAKVTRYTRSRMIEIGGEDEKQKAFLFRRSNTALSEALLDTDGCYFVRKNPDPKNRKEWNDARAALIEKLGQMENSGAKPTDIRDCRVQIALNEELLKGWPERISNFSLECLYRVRAEDTGEIEYYCKAWIPAERQRITLRIPAKKLARLAEFREFCLQRLSSTFKGGEKDLQCITEDLNTDSRWRIVDEVNAYGWHRESNLYLFGDCGWDGKGRRILPDRDMVFWHGDNGYQIDGDTERIGEGFDQRAPLMHPDKPTPENFPEQITGWCADMRDTLGGLEGWALIGAAVGYLAMPAFFAKHGQQHPGIWLHGTYGDGKTKVARWLCRLFGFGELNGVGIGAATEVALFRIMAQYSCLLVFFDEYRGSEITDQKNTLLRNAFDRSAAPKGRIDNMRRTRTTLPNTTPLICGESECFDAATRSRYVQAVISKTKRVIDPGNHRFHRMEHFADSLFFLTRELLDRRPLFETAFMAAYDIFQQKIESSDLRKKINDRAGVTYGVAFAGMAALVETLDLKRLHDPVNREFLPFLMEYMTQADMETRATGIIEMFWESFLSGVRQGGINSRHLRRTWAVPHPDNHGQVLLAGAHDDGAREILLINAVDAFSQFKEFLRRRGDEFTLPHSNLAKYLRNQTYWVWKKRGTGWKARFDGKRVAAWGVYLDEFPWAEDVDGLVDPDDPLQQGED